MFKRKEPEMEDVKMSAYENVSPENVLRPKIEKSNTILKGSKLVGNIIISQDLEMNGDVEGNITSEEKSNIVIRGKCKGNIKTKEGNVDIEGEMGEGDIIAGGHVTLVGKFHGGKIEAKEKIYINGEFNGKLESNEIEIGSEAQGKGELHYREYITIQKGAKVEAQIKQIQKESKEVKKSSDSKVVTLDLPMQEIKTDKA